MPGNMYNYELPVTYNSIRHNAAFGDLQQAIQKSKEQYEANMESPPKLQQVIDIDMGRGRLPHCQDRLGDNSELRSRCNGWAFMTNGSITLYKYQEVPSFLQGNPYVKGGYTVMLSLHMCVKSLFVWTNETVNAWTHLLGFFLFLFCCVWDNAVWIPSIEGSFSDHLVISLGLICYQFCMLCSTGYHLFRCHSEKAHHQWLALDLTGISVGLLGCYLPGIHFGFYCLSVWRDIYMLVIGVLFAAVFFYQTQPRYYTERWFRKRLLLYCGLTAYGIIPTLHWIYLNGGLGSEIVQVFAPKILVVYLLGCLAFFFYITKYPEKLFPGWFDYVGSSHQLWHVVVVIAFLWWHHSGQQLLIYRTQQPCTSASL